MALHPAARKRLEINLDYHARLAKAHDEQAKKENEKRPRRAVHEHAQEGEEGEGSVRRRRSKDEPQPEPTEVEQLRDLHQRVAEQLMVVLAADKGPAKVVLERARRPSLAGAAVVRDTNSIPTIIRRA